MRCRRGLSPKESQGSRRTARSLSRDAIASGRHLLADIAGAGLTQSHMPDHRWGAATGSSKLARCCPAARCIHMRDIDLRKALRVRAARHHDADPETRVIEELELGPTARADVIVLNGRIEGYEIKSDHDSLVRLTHQAAAYEAVCDRVWLATTERFASVAGERLPAWWGVLVAKTTGESISLVRRRAARAHPHQSREALLDLLWRDELAALCGRYAPHAVRARATSSSLRDAIADTDASAKRLASDVRAALLIREGWRAVPLCASGDAVFPPAAKWSGSRSVLPPHRRR